jgi:hypothetical protein
VLAAGSTPASSSAPSCSPCTLLWWRHRQGRRGAQPLAAVPAAHEEVGRRRASGSCRPSTLAAVPAAHEEVGSSPRWRHPQLLDGGARGAGCRRGGGTRRSGRRGGGGSQRGGGWARRSEPRARWLRWLARGSEVAVGLVLTTTLALSALPGGRPSMDRNRARFVLARRGAAARGFSSPVLAKREAQLVEEARRAAPCLPALAQQASCRAVAPLGADTRRPHHAPC